jgi:hypothetical protein
MARGELMKKLLSSYGRDDDFRAVVEQIIAEKAFPRKTFAMPSVTLNAAGCDYENYRTTSEAIVGTIRSSATGQSEGTSCPQKRRQASSGTEAGKRSWRADTARNR